MDDDVTEPRSVILAGQGRRRSRRTWKSVEDNVNLNENRQAPKITRQQ